MYGSSQHADLQAATYWPGVTLQGYAASLVAMSTPSLVFWEAGSSADESAQQLLAAPVQASRSIAVRGVKEVDALAHSVVENLLQLAVHALVVAVQELVCPTARCLWVRQQAVTTELRVMEGRWSTAFNSGSSLTQAHGRGFQWPHIAQLTPVVRQLRVTGRPADMTWGSCMVCALMGTQSACTNVRRTKA